LPENVLNQRHLIMCEDIESVLTLNNLRNNLLEAVDGVLYHRVVMYLVGSTSFTNLDLLRNKGGTVTATQLCSIIGQVLLQQFSSITCYSRVENRAALVLRWIVTMLN
jgi:hypothetical protein